MRDRTHQAVRSQCVRDARRTTRDHEPDAQDARPRCNLVAERGPDLCYGKRDAAVVVVEQPTKVDKYTLRRLRPQVALRQTDGTDGCAEHQVERLRLRQLVVGARRTHVVRSNRLRQLCLIIRAHMVLHPLVLRALRIVQLRVCQEAIHVLRNQMVRAEKQGFIRGILDQVVLEAVHVAGRSASRTPVGAISCAPPRACDG